MSPSSPTTAPSPITAPAPAAAPERTRTRPGRRGVALLLAGVAVVLAACLPPSPASDNALRSLNAHRATAGVPAAGYDSGASWGAQLHADYLQHHQLNATTAHSERRGQAGYTDAGAAAAKKSVVSGWPKGSTGPQAVTSLMTAPFHGLWLVHPDLQRVGWGESHGRQGARFVMDVYTGNPQHRHKPSRTVTFPGHGRTSTLKEISRKEWPNPLAPCPGFSHPAGGPVMAMFDRAPRITSVTLQREGAPVEICWYDEHRYRNADKHQQDTARSTLGRLNAVIIIGKGALAPGNYQATVVNHGRPFTWHFTIR